MGIFSAAGITLFVGRSITASFRTFYRGGAAKDFAAPRNRAWLQQIWSPWRPICPPMILRLVARSSAGAATVEVLIHIAHTTAATVTKTGRWHVAICTLFGKVRSAVIVGQTKVGNLTAARD